MRGSSSGPGPPSVGEGIPDLKWINRHLPITDAARKLELRFGAGGMIHCWHPERHQHRDRTPSVSIRRRNNTIKCFGCGTRPMTVVDLVMDARGFSVADAARWLDQNFAVRRIPPRKHLAEAGSRRPYLVGMEQPLELLVQSGIWARLSVPAQRIVPVLLSFAESAGLERFEVTISYRGLTRYSGLKSFSAVSKGLEELSEIGWLQRAGNAARGLLLRETGRYVVTPFADAVRDLGNTLSLEERESIQAERELRNEQRRERRSLIAEHARKGAKAEGSRPKAKDEGAPSAITTYESLYSRNSVVTNHASPTLSPEVITTAHNLEMPASVSEFRD
jgi:hypothetical protein